MPKITGRLGVAFIWAPVLLSGVAVLARTAEARQADTRGPFRAVEVRRGAAVVEWDPVRLDGALRNDGRLRVRGFRLGAGPSVDLELRSFRVVGPRTRFVVGRRDDADEPFAYDPGRVTLLRGRVAGRPGSRVFLALGRELATGYVDLGPGVGRYRVSSALDEPTRRASADRLLTVFPATGPSEPPADVPMCGLLDELADVHRPVQELLGPSAMNPGPRHIELAVETDFEFFELFGDLTAAFDYLVAMYGAVSDIYVRDVNTRVELVFARLWDDPADLFNDVDPTPLPEFRDYWNANMAGVSRDVAQLLSGRRDYPFGGQAYLNALCNSNAYSVVGYASGAFPDPAFPSPYHYDISVTAHELGHNAGTGHTHDSANSIDTCNNPATTPQRGTIMSYCGQTWSGGNANRDLYFHAVIQANMEAYIGGASCVTLDCNANGTPDNDDVQGASLDVNANGVPDECEDCNGNLVLDDADISTGASFDLDGDNVPDECQPDCNGNSIPDEKDIADGTSFDDHGNLVPDGCEPDCDLDTRSDFSQIQLDMTLDVDRDTVLDQCQNCDADSLNDMEELSDGHHVWIASGLDATPLRQFHPTTGVLSRESPVSVNQGQDVLATPDGRVLVTSGVDHRVLEFDAKGAYLGDFVAPFSGGLTYPTGLTLSAEGDVLVSSRNTHSVLAFDQTGGFAGVFVEPGSGTLVEPFGLTLGPDGQLYVTSASNEILRYDGTTGEYRGKFVDAADNGGLDQPRGMEFKPDGNLLVASFGTDEVLEYEAGTGRPLGKWSQVGTATRLTQDSPWGVRVGPNGNVFVVRTGEDYGSGSGSNDHDHDHGHDDSDVLVDGTIVGLHLTNAQIYEFDVRNGNFVRTYLGGNDHGHLFPTGFAFVPGWDVDCNFNQLQDDCDVDLGLSPDDDLDGTPDECQVDCNANATLDRLDVIPFGSSRDCNYNLVPDECDASGTSADCTGNGIPDECEADCNENGVADSCDLDADPGLDCDGNAVLDGCDVTDDLEVGAGWLVGAPDDTATAGVWERGDPVGTVAQPEHDHTIPPGTSCFVTGQGTPGGGSGSADVDGGKTTLTSPALDLSATPDGGIGYWRWFSNSTGSNPGEDVLTVEVSADDGQSWSVVETVGPGGPEVFGGWFFHRFRVADFVPASATVRVRFVAADTGGTSVVEAAIDDLVVVAGCPGCAADTECDNGLSCTIDSCDAGSGECGHVVVADACRIDGTCYAGGDLNPLTDCEVCDPSQPDQWSPALPTEIAGLGLEVTPSTRLSWSGQGNGFVYDLAGGTLTDLVRDGGVVGATCLADGLAASNWDDPRPDPGPGQGFYYLVRSRKGCSGPGTYGRSSDGIKRVPTATCP